MSDPVSGRRHPALDELFSRRGAVKAVADGLRISTAAVSKWRVVPIARVADVAQILGVPEASIPTAAKSEGRQGEGETTAVVPPRPKSPSNHCLVTHILTENKRQGWGLPPAVVDEFLKLGLEK